MALFKKLALLILLLSQVAHLINERKIKNTCVLFGDCHIRAIKHFNTLSMLMLFASVTLVSKVYQQQYQLVLKTAIFLQFLNSYLSELNM